MGFAVEFISFLVRTTVPKRPRNMETLVIGAAFRRVLIVQASAVVLATVAILVFAGTLPAGSALIGGGAVLAGNLAYAFVARPATVFAVSGKRVLLRHMLAEVAKLCIALGLMFAAFASQSFDGGWLLVGMGSALLAHWASFLFRR
jgi:F0F1-type ATP synthase assembly protein I